MAIFVKSKNGKDARDLILQRVKESMRKSPAERDIKTWKVERKDGEECLVHESANWGDCGHFELDLTEGGKVLKLGLRVAPPHYEKGAKWPDLLGALHSELVQLLLNRFPELVDMDGDGLKVVSSYYEPQQ